MSLIPENSDRSRIMPTVGGSESMEPPSANYGFMIGYIGGIEAGRIQGRTELVLKLINKLNRLVEFGNSLTNAKDKLLEASYQEDVMALQKEIEETFDGLQRELDLAMSTLIGLAQNPKEKSADSSSNNE